VAHLSNADLSRAHLPADEASDDDLLVFARSFDGYEVWGGLRPVQMVTYRVSETWQQTRELPRCLTVARTALFGEWRSERFVDYGGFGDSNSEWRTHRSYMRELARAISRLIANGEREDEHEAALDWIESHPPVSAPSQGGGLADVDHDVRDAVALTARLLARDVATGARIKEALLRDRLQVAIGHLTGALVEVERHAPIPEFQGVGPVDLIVRPGPDAPSAVLVECKWSRDAKRDKIYEGAWDAVKLALATRASPQAEAVLVTGADRAAWAKSETADLFATGQIDTAELWARPLAPAGVNGGNTVGADCNAGGRGNRFTHAPARLDITHLISADIASTDWQLRASHVRGQGDLVEFAPSPEFPALINDRWLAGNVPTMPVDQYDRLLALLAERRWTPEELAAKVHPLRSP